MPASYSKTLLVKFFAPSLTVKNELFASNGIFLIAMNFSL